MLWLGGGTAGFVSCARRHGYPGTGLNEIPLKDGCRIRGMQQQVFASQDTQGAGFISIAASVCAEHFLESM